MSFCGSVLVKTGSKSRLPGLESLPQHWTSRWSFCIESPCLYNVKNVSLASWSYVPGTNHALPKAIFVTWGFLVGEARRERKGTFQMKGMGCEGRCCLGGKACSLLSVFGLAFETAATPLTSVGTLCWNVTPRIWHLLILPATVCSFVALKIWINDEY